MESKTDLKPLDERVLEIIKKSYISTGFSPSVAEIAEVLEMSKGSVLADSVKRLEVAGEIIYSNGRKYFIPAKWRELSAAGVEALSFSGEIDPVVVYKELSDNTGFISALQPDILKIRNVAFSEGVECEKQRVRDLTNARLERHRKKKRG